MKNRQFIVLLVVIICCFLAVYLQNVKIFNFVNESYQQYRYDRWDLIDRLNEIKIMINEKEL